MKYTKTILHLLLILLFVNNNILFSQEVDYRNHRIEQFDISSGMPSNNVLSVSQDQYGFLWIGTAVGLSRFDGKKFVSYQQGTTNRSLSHNYAQNLLTASDGNIWTATSRGLNIYDYQGDSIRVILNDLGYDISSNDIISFSEVENGIWIATYDKGIDFYDYKSNTFSKPSLPDIFNQIFITYVLADNVGNLWVGTLSNGLYCYSLDSKKTRHYQISRVQQIVQDSKGTVWAVTDRLYYFDQKTMSLKSPDIKGLDSSMRTKRIYEDKNGLLWVGFVNGLGYFNLDNYYLTEKALFTEVRQRGENYDMPFREVNSIMMDRDSNIWIGTFGDGIFMIHNKQDKFSHITHNYLDKTSLSNSKILSIASNNKGRFYISTNGSGIDVLDEDFKKIDNYKVDQNNSKGLISNYIPNIFQDSNDNLWCGGYGISLLKSDTKTFEQFYYDNQNPQNSLLSNIVRTFAESPDQSVWIGTDKGISRYKNGNITNDFYNHIGRRIDVRSIIIVDDFLWIGTYGDGIISYHTKTGAVETYFDHENKPSNYVRSMKLKGDSLYIATQGGGIKLFSLVDKDFKKTYTIDDGLKNNYPQAIEIDKSGKIWFASNQGICCIDNDKIRYFDSKDGVQKNEFFNSFKTIDKNGVENFMFCGNDGINYFNPDDLPQYLKSNRIIFNLLKIYNEPIHPNQKNNGKILLSKNIIETEKIELSHKQSFFTIGFVNIDYNYSQFIQYQYMLKGFDTTWNNIEHQEEISFRNLPPGKYQLLVKVVEFDNIANDNIAELEIVIHPPLWKTPFAFVIYSALIILLFFLIWRIATIKVRAQNKIKLEKSERQKEEEIHQTKLNFFTNISHEIRTPLTLIIGPLEIMKVKYPSLIDEISIISQNANKLLTLVNQLLDFRKSEMNEMHLKVRNSSLTEQIYKIISSFDGLRIEKQMKLSVVSSPLKINGYYDTDFIDKIMYNLLSNAFKFTPANGKITVEILEKLINKERWAEIIVKDSGNGIDANDIKLIFNRFHQSKKSENNKGTGIGLNLVKSLVELHHGKISVNSTEGVGTTFKIDIPIDDAFYAENEKEKTVSDVENVKDVIESTITVTENINKNNLKILVVDDEPDICKYVTQILYDYNITSVSNGKEALSILTQQDFDLVISDVMMPEMDGTTLCEKIKKNIETSHIPVILLTAKSSIESKIEGLKSGADSYISKPFHPEHLRVRVEKLLESREIFKNKFSKTLSFNLEHNESPSVDDLLLEKILKYINTNISNSELNSEKLAKEMGVSRMTLHRKLKLLTGQTTNELIRGIRLKEAAYQIENSTKNISDICYEVGFNSPSYFTSCFSEQYGMTPTEYQKKIKSGNDI